MNKNGESLSSYFCWIRASQPSVMWPAASHIAVFLVLHLLYISIEFIVLWFESVVNETQWLIDYPFNLHFRIRALHSLRFCASHCPLLFFRCSWLCISATMTSTSPRCPSRLRRCVVTWWICAETPATAAVIWLKCGEAPVRTSLRHSWRRNCFHTVNC